MALAIDRKGDKFHAMHLHFITDSTIHHINVMHLTICLEDARQMRAGKLYCSESAHEA